VGRIKEKRMKDLKAINEFLDTGNLVIKYDWIPEGYQALYESDEDGSITITLNIYKNILWCLIHECLHEIRPELGDLYERTDKYAREILRSMSKEQQRALFKKLTLLAEVPPSNRLPLT
jgi:hypothetical protein